MTIICLNFGKEVHETSPPCSLARKAHELSPFFKSWHLKGRSLIKSRNTWRFVILIAFWWRSTLSALYLNHFCRGAISFLAALARGN